MNRSKKIEDLIDMVRVLKRCGTAPLLLKAHEDMLEEALRDHLSAHFLSLAHDTPEYIEFTEGGGIIFWSLGELIKCYIDNVPTWSNV
jgi:hypothetical protein